ncbi:MAG: hypothetical protein R3F62_10485 [Planctomycetota bacterium]
MLRRVVLGVLVSVGCAWAQTTIVGRGERGPQEASARVLRSEGELRAWLPGAQLQEGHAYVAVCLGSFPAGTRVQRVEATVRDDRGWQVELRVEADVPVRGRALAQPWAVVRFAGDPVSVSSAVEVTLTLGRTRFSSAPEEVARLERTHLRRLREDEARGVARMSEAAAEARRLRDEVRERVLEAGAEPSSFVRVDEDLVGAFKVQRALNAVRREEGAFAEVGRTDRRLGSLSGDPAGKEPQELGGFTLRSGPPWIEVLSEAYDAEVRALERQARALEALERELARFLPAHRGLNERLGQSRE